MRPLDALVDFLAKRMTLAPKHRALIRSLTHERALRRNQFLHRAGDQVKDQTFVASGCLRRYVLDPKGKEHILQFAAEGWWLSDVESILDRTPSRFFVQAVVPTQLLVLHWSAHERLLREIPGFAEAYIMGLQRQSIARERRVIAALTAPPDERYHDFLRTYPSIAASVPQHMLASYLGIAPETLSRVRRRIGRERRLPAGRLPG
ncbi:MAG: Crp/Fnr family transcriptional regulator [Candidatus Eiseniibacteriota bacterium]